MRSPPLTPPRFFFSDRRPRADAPLPPVPARVPRSALVGEVDEEADAELALDEIVAEPLRPVVH